MKEVSYVSIWENNNWVCTKYGGIILKNCWKFFGIMIFFCIKKFWKYKNWRWFVIYVL